MGNHRIDIGGKSYYPHQKQDERNAIFEKYSQIVSFFLIDTFLHLNQHAR
jgi:hypothetical protein